jgi:hypothetical protein
VLDRFRAPDDPVYFLQWYSHRQEGKLVGIVLFFRGKDSWM